MHDPAQRDKTNSFLNLDVSGLGDSYQRSLARLDHYVAAWRRAWAEERERNRAGARNREEMQFLPQALGVVETPPPLVGRIIVLVVAGFFIAAIAWAYFSHTDVVAMAMGKIIPAGQVKVIQPLEGGTITAIHVHEGKTVTQGEVLVELDTTQIGADNKRISRELDIAKMDAARWRALLGDVDGSTGVFDPPGDVDPDIILQYQDLMMSQRREFKSQLVMLGHQIDERKSRVRLRKNEVGRLEASLKLVRVEADARKYLVDKGYSPKLSYIPVQRQVIDFERGIDSAREEIIEARSALASVEAQREVVINQFERTILDALTLAERRISGLAQEMVKLEQMGDLMKLRAPISGVVQSLSIHTIGGVVTPAQGLMVIVPSKVDMEVEAKIANRDIGFIRIGQPVELKFEAFQFTKYGTVPGKITHISTDAIPDEAMGLVYAIRIVMDSTTMQINGEAVPLTPGMAVTAEVKTGTRRIIEYLLAPLLRYQNESLRER